MKNPKIRWAVIGSIAVLTAISAGALVKKKRISWKNLKEQIASIPWEFEGQEKYR